MMNFFAPSPRGLEALLADELAHLGAQNLSVTEGGVAFEGDWQVLYYANLWSRLASRIYVQVGMGRYENETDIYALSRGVEWDEWFESTQTLRVDIAAQRSPLQSLQFATLRVKDGICDYFRDLGQPRPNVNKVAADVKVYAFLTSEMCSLYVDTSGEALFKRGWRKEKGIAPLRENLAAGLIYLSGWAGDQPLLDGMCGSGTLLIEAAMMACEIAPGLHRRFGFEKLRGYDKKQWFSIHHEAALQQKTAEQMDGSLQLLGSDADAEMVEIARSNAEHAGVGDLISWTQADVRHMRPPVGATVGTVVMNLPYGERMGFIGEKDTELFYSTLGATFKHHFTGWSIFTLTADADLVKYVRLKPSKRTPIWNGPLECRWYKFDMVTGRPRKEKSVPDEGHLTAEGDLAAS